MNRGLRNGSLQKRGMFLVSAAKKMFAIGLVMVMVM